VEFLQAFFRQEGLGLPLTSGAADGPGERSGLAA
jgi:hypothetical protein